MFRRILCVLGAFSLHAAEEAVEILSLEAIPYEQFVQRDAAAIERLKRALHEDGIVALRGIPGYREKVEKYIDTARQFSSLPEEAKGVYSPDRSTSDITGYEIGREKFLRPDGKWVVDNLKTSYYAFVPDNSLNKWPGELDLQGPFQELGRLMSSVGSAVMREVGLLGPTTGIELGDTPQLGRMLYYKKDFQGKEGNPFWCGAHYDHSMFTALLPAFYFVEGRPVEEPAEAGLFVRPAAENKFKKIVANDPDLLLFQVGEFGQLSTNDAIQATEHRVHKAEGSVERYTLALFFDAPQEIVIRSTSKLTSDARYGGPAGSPCSYQHWGEESYKRYLVKQKEE